MSKREYNAFRNHVKDQIPTIKRIYFQLFAISNIRNDIKKTWSTVNNVLRESSRKNKFEINLTVFKDVIYNDDQYIPQNFKQYFPQMPKI